MVDRTLCIREREIRKEPEEKSCTESKEIGKVQDVSHIPFQQLWFPINLANFSYNRHVSSLSSHLKLIQSHRRWTEHVPPKRLNKIIILHVVITLSYTGPESLKTYMMTMMLI
jgi:hypothetical protein